MNNTVAISYPRQLEYSVAAAVSMHSITSSDVIPLLASNINSPPQRPLPPRYHSLITQATNVDKSSRDEKLGAFFFF